MWGLDNNNVFKGAFQMIEQNLPLEEGKTYVTKLQTKEKFTVQRIISIKDKITKMDKQYLVFGFYESNPILKMCLINPDRLVHETVQTTVIIAKCPTCGK